ncbi:MAG: bifunctional diaminohydroxyphosphoribosylaminopyrimidine deaminase/5-amino-6-(5-phosphoribosylamino)uracil reductase RibD [Flavobacteriales bacterium]|nr:bifunctional diaminohydroxyphosphoribosylaminopyrimidine deaminase/5-amino-6-(5-phosphoribosylamino)uracil reductase RibD [Flavobacteriales bacterium]
MNAWPSCRPNPMVGALLFKGGKVISEGYTSAYGGLHAEVNAIQGVEDELLKLSTLYVSLEPCAHFGKTPPCSDLIIEKKIPKVVLGCRDPFSEVSGKGIEKLKRAGVEVIEGVLEAECLAMNKRFITFHEKKRPYVILKWAESSDGFIDVNRKGGKAAAISNSMTNQLVHKWRSEEEGILVGGETARQDNPSLTTRAVTGDDPRRFIWTRKGIGDGLKLNELGFDSLECDSVGEALNELYSRGIQSVLVEGGRKVLQQFIDQGSYDEIRRIVSEKQLHDGVSAPEFKEVLKNRFRSGTDTVEIY